MQEHYPNSNNTLSGPSALQNPSRVWVTVSFHNRYGYRQESLTGPVEAAGINSNLGPGAGLVSSSMKEYLKGRNIWLGVAKPFHGIVPALKYSWTEVLCWAEEGLCGGQGLEVALHSTYNPEEVKASD